MSSIERNWQFTEEYHARNEAIEKARRDAAEFGIDTVSSAMAAEIALIASLSRARQICEIGTGTGTSGLAMLSRNDDADLTTIDIEGEHLRAAKENFSMAQIPNARLRVISGDALTVLPRMNLNSYDLVFVDADPLNMLEYVEHALKIVRPGGLVLVPHALWHGTVAEPAQRGEITVDYRTLLNEIAQSDAVDSVLNPVGDGLLTVQKLE